MDIEVWSDVVCPWCWIGKRHLEAALGRFAHADEVEVVWRAFELDPSAVSDGAGVTAGGSGDAGGSGSPAVAGGGRPSYAARLAAKYGTDVAAGQQMVDTMVAPRWAWTCASTARSPPTPSTPTRWSTWRSSAAAPPCRTP